jgi:hypothetical protein
VFRCDPTADSDSVRELNETLARCRVLLLERRDLVRTRERSDWLSALTSKLVSSVPPPEEELSGMAALAFVGWCWRSAERGDHGKVRDAVLSAYAFAAADSSVPAGYAPAWAVWKFLDDGGRPGLASPGRSKRSRLAFLDAAFAKMHTTYGEPAGIAAETARETFERGVVLSDVERLALGRPALLDELRT